MQAARTRRLAEERLHRMQDRMMVGESDTGTRQRYVGTEKLPKPTWESDNAPLREHLAALERLATGRPPETPEEAELAGMSRQAALHRAQLQELKGLQA